MSVVDNTGDGGVAREESDPDAPPVGNLWRIVQAHIDRYGVREAELARRLGTQPQTLNSWKLRGVRAVPSTKLLRKLAEVTGTPYKRVLVAALLDAGLVDRVEAAELLRADDAGAGAEAG